MNNTAEKLDNNVKFSYNSFKLPIQDKVYWIYQLQEFSNNIAKRVDCDVNYIQFGKQDSRGALSITIFDHRHCVPMQRHFISKDALLGYVEGFNRGMSDVKYL